MSEIQKSGFVSIVGRPNVGKSTLMNQLVGERLSIITSKAQTTRHRIMGIISGEDFQIVYSDTPGIIDPKYDLQKSMMSFVNASLDDADLILLVTDMVEGFDHDELLKKLADVNAPIIVVINKVDLKEQDRVAEKIAEWKAKGNFLEVIPVSALHSFNTDTVLDLLKANLPVHPPYFPEDELTDKTERFFVSEIIREKIFLNYEQEIPYSTEVVVTSFKEEEEIIRISVEIMVERDSQKGIIIGKSGSMLKKIGTEARKDLEAFFGKKVFLQQHVKVDENWRKDKRKLKKYGYSEN